jgi:hypothetical protein
MRIIFIFLFISVFINYSCSQEKKSIRYIDNEMFSDSISIYKSLYQNIEEIDNFVKPIYIAAHYYPELIHAKIKFGQRRMKTSMAARPSIWFIFQKRENRKYKILVNNDSIHKAPRLIHNMSLNMQIGVIGHELAHIKDYSNMSSFHLFTYGFKYLFKNQRKLIEHKTDSIAIAHGLGWQIYDFASYINSSDKISKKYKKYKLNIYLRPKQIADIISLYNTNTLH